MASTLEMALPSAASHPPSRFRRLALGFGYCACIAGIIWLADHPRYAWLFAQLRALPLGDKVGHFVLIGGMGFIFNYVLRCRTCRLFGRRLLLGSVLVFSLAALEEASQIFFPSRSFDLKDLAGDFLGIWFFGWLVLRVYRRGCSIPPA